jgi:hypothetical protein
MKLLLSSSKSAAESTKKWLPDREGKGENESLRKLVISHPIKSGKEIPFGFWWWRYQ